MDGPTDEWILPTALPYRLTRSLTKVVDANEIVSL